MVVTGAGTAHELVAHIVSVADPAAGLLLHLAGDTLAGDLMGELELQGFRVVQPVVYRMQPARALSEDTVEQLAMGEIEGVILMSPQNGVNLCRADAQAGPGHGCPRARAFLPVGGNCAASASRLGAVRSEIAEAPAPGRSACPDRCGRGKLATARSGCGTAELSAGAKLRSPEAAIMLPACRSLEI